MAQYGGIENIKEIVGEPSMEANVYKMEDEYGWSYYYRGEQDQVNNNVIFAEMQWKVIRINGDGSIRLIYNGECPNNNCSINTKGPETKVSTAMYNDKTEDNQYVGYMHGSANESTNLEEAQSNKKNSTMKEILDTWYADNIQDKGYGSSIADNLFCNDRVLLYGDLGYGTEGSQYRNSDFIWVWSSFITLKCSQKNDRFTVNDTTVGNGALTYPVGLITGDEVSLAGWGNEKNYLNTDEPSWTMSPAIYSDQAYMLIIEETGLIMWRYLNDNTVGYRPVINLIATKTAKGSGSSTNPFIVQ